jgi:hypothetical protein
MHGKQLHLFDFKEKKKKEKKYHQLILPLDVFIFGGIIIILFCTYIFSLGVKRGEKIAFLKLKQVKSKIDLKDKNKDLEKKRRYVIQVATYVKEDIALKEAEKLKDKGYPVFISKKGKYIVIFVGEFKNKKEAEENMRILKKRYQDCFMRRL